jgi:hypothetical protein
MDQATYDFRAGLLPEKGKAPKIQVGRSTVFMQLKRRGYSMANQDQPTLYERLGGVYSIATVVDDFITV